MPSSDPDPTQIIKVSDAGPALVARGFEAPGKCLVTGDIDGPFVDADVHVGQEEQHLYLHAPWVEQVARDLLEMVPRKDVDALLERVQEAEAKLESLEADTAAVEAAERVLVGVA